jgi:hypothetical protein
MKHCNQRRSYVAITYAARRTPVSVEFVFWVFFPRVFGTRLMWPWSGCRIVVTTSTARDTRGSNVTADSRLLWRFFFLVGFLCQVKCRRIGLYSKPIPILYWELALPFNCPDVGSVYGKSDAVNYTCLCTGWSKSLCAPYNYNTERYN